MTSQFNVCYGGNKHDRRERGGFFSLPVRDPVFMEFQQILDSRVHLDIKAD